MILGGSIFLEISMEMHLVIGGPFVTMEPNQISPHMIDIVGLFATYDDALDAWRGASQRTIDDAEMRYMIVPLHRLVAPMLGTTSLAA